jgi:hypothetical protein
VIQRLAKQWTSPDFEKRTALEKYGIALKEAGQPQLIAGRRPYQDVRLLLELRHYLVHNKPEWYEIPSPSDKKPRPHPLGKELKPKFARCNLAWNGSNFFPEGCLGYGCAQWGIVSAIAVITDFETRLGTESKLRVLGIDPIRSA